MFLRIFSHDCSVTNSEGENILLKKKANSKLRTFKINDKDLSELDFDTVDAIEVKKVPKDESDKLQTNTVIVHTQFGHAIIFQPLSPIYFLIINSDGILEKAECHDLTVDDTLVVYDEDDKTWIFDDIKDFYLTETIENIDDDILEEDEKEPKILSNYIINTHKKGLILNNFFMC